MLKNLKLIEEEKEQDEQFFILISDSLIHHNYKYTYNYIYFAIVLHVMQLKLTTKYLRNQLRIHFNVALLNASECLHFYFQLSSNQKKTHNQSNRDYGNDVNIYIQFIVINKLKKLINKFIFLYRRI